MRQKDIDRLDGRTGTDTGNATTEVCLTSKRGRIRAQTTVYEQVGGVLVRQLDAPTLADWLALAEVAR